MSPPPLDGTLPENAPASWEAARAYVRAQERANQHAPMGEAPPDAAAQYTMHEGVNTNMHIYGEPVEGTYIPAQSPWRTGHFVSAFNIRGADGNAEQHPFFGLEFLGRNSRGRGSRALAQPGGGHCIIALDEHGFRKTARAHGGMVMDEMQSDRDQDGTPDYQDAFPDDPWETRDRDGDGVGDNRQRGERPLHEVEAENRDAINTIRWRLGLASARHVPLDPKFNKYNGDLDKAVASFGASVGPGGLATSRSSYINDLVSAFTNSTDMGKTIGVSSDIVNQTLARDLAEATDRYMQKATAGPLEGQSMPGDFATNSAGPSPGGDPIMAMGGVTATVKKILVDGFEMALKKATESGSSSQAVWENICITLGTDFSKTIAEYTKHVTVAAKGKTVLDVPTLGFPPAITPALIKKGEAGGGEALAGSASQPLDGLILKVSQRRGIDKKNNHNLNLTTGRDSVEILSREISESFKTKVSTGMTSGDVENIIRTWAESFQAAVYNFFTSAADPDGASVIITLTFEGAQGELVPTSMITTSTPPVPNSPPPVTNSGTRISVFGHLR